MTIADKLYYVCSSVAKLSGLVEEPLTTDDGLVIYYCFDVSILEPRTAAFIISFCL